MSWRKLHFMSGARSGSGAGWAQVAIMLAVSCSGWAASPAMARDYSLHMLVHVPTRCTIHRTQRLIEPVFSHPDEGARVAPSADASIRITCNVPYHMQFNRIGRRASLELGPQASRRDGDQFDLAVTLPGRDETLQGSCSFADLDEHEGGCVPILSSGGARRAAAVDVARIALIAQHQPMAAVVTDVPASSVMTTALAAQALAVQEGVSVTRPQRHLKVLVCARY